MSRNGHPRVVIDFEEKCLWLNGNRYSVDLSADRRTGDLLDTIFQVAAKDWADNAIVGELVNAIEEMCERTFDNNAQGVYCPSGASMIVDWKKGTYRRA